jgi:hypothetical protein
MKVLQTESADTKTFEELEWHIIPLNIPVLTVESPDVSLELTEIEEKEVLPGDINFVPRTTQRIIGMMTHQALLEESLVEHKEIWRTLAEK